MGVAENGPEVGEGPASNPAAVTCSWPELRHWLPCSIRMPHHPRAGHACSASQPADTVRTIREQVMPAELRHPADTARTIREQVMPAELRQPLTAQTIHASKSGQARNSYRNPGWHRPEVAPTATPISTSAHQSPSSLGNPAPMAAQEVRRELDRRERRRHRSHPRQPARQQLRRQHHDDDPGMVRVPALHLRPQSQQDERSWRHRQPSGGRSPGLPVHRAGWKPPCSPAPSTLN